MAKEKASCPSIGVDKGNALRYSACMNIIWKGEPYKLGDGTRNPCYTGPTPGGTAFLIVLLVLGLLFWLYPMELMSSLILLGVVTSIIMFLFK